MGAANSTIEEDKALKLCRERKHYVRQALDGRCLLADAHVAYIRSLRNTGIALRKFVVLEAPNESSLCTSTSATPELLALTDKSTSQFSNSSVNLSQHVETGESSSPVPSPLSSGGFHVSHMKASRIFSTKVEEKPSVPVTVTLQSSTTTQKHLTSLTEENLSLDTPSPPPGTPPWDYFGLFHPVDNHFPFQEGRGLNHVLDDDDDARRLREEEGIPELEDEGDRTSIDGRDDSDSEDDFDQSSREPLVRIFQNRNAEHQLAAIPSVESISSETNQQSGEGVILTNGTSEIAENPEMKPPKMATSSVVLPINGNPKENGQEYKLGAKDFFSCMKDIEKLFLKACESGTEVPRMLEANKVQISPLFPEGIANKTKPSAYLTACFACCLEEAPNPHPQVAATQEIKYLTWHRSASSNSSSSKNPLRVASKDDVEDMSGNIFSTISMNSGSHDSTLDRLFAWERKLYDEVKASGVVRKEYDMKCRLLRHQDQRGESSYKIDKTRASVKDLHSRIRVAIHRIESISKKIEEIRDKELQPQLEELIKGLSRMWAMMQNCHRSQCSIISLPRNIGSIKVSMSSEYQRQVTTLERELNSLSSSFIKWISAQRSYVQAINEWLLKCVFPLKRQKSSRRKQLEFSPRRDIAPPIFVTCRDWLRRLDELPTKEVVDAIKELLTLLMTQFSPRPDKGHASSNLSFSFTRKAGETEQGEHIHQNETLVDWSLNYDSLQSCLVIFLDRLKTFAESSVIMYETLKISVDEARDAYEKR